MILAEAVYMFNRLFAAQPSEVTQASGHGVQHQSKREILQSITAQDCVAGLHAVTFPVNIGWAQWAQRTLQAQQAQ